METVPETQMRFIKDITHNPAVVLGLLTATVVGAPIALAVAWGLHYLSRLPWL